MREERKVISVVWFSVAIAVLLVINVIIGALLVTRMNRKIADAEKTVDEIRAEKRRENVEVRDVIKVTDRKADSVGPVQTDDPVIALTFQGVTDYEKMNELLEMLGSPDRKCTFFPDAISAAEDDDIFKAFKRQGHVIGSYSLDGGKHLEELTQNELIKNFYKSNKTIKRITGKPAKYLKCNVTTYTDELREAAYAAGNDYIVESSAYVSSKSFKNEDEAAHFLDQLPKGSVISVKLNEELNEQELAKGKQHYNEKPAEDKQSDAEAQISTEDDTNVMDAVRYLLRAMRAKGLSSVTIKDLPKHEKKNEGALLKTTAFGAKKADPYAATAKKKRKKNGGKLADVVKSVGIVKDVLSYEFYDISNEKDVNAVLSILKKDKITGTFFVNEKELKQYPKRVKKIAKAGHEIGIWYIDDSKLGFVKQACQIHNSAKKIKKLTGKAPKLMMQPWEAVDDQTREVASALGYKLIGYDCYMAKEAYRNGSTAKEIVEGILNTNMRVARQGQLWLFRMSWYKKSKMTSKVVDYTKKLTVDSIRVTDYQTKEASLPSGALTNYKVVSVSKMLSYKDKMYTYPLPSEKILPELRDKIGPGHLAGQDLITRTKKGFIGVSYHPSPADMPGFTQEEIDELDGTGRIHTSRPLIFLTFDDWGDDISVNRILEVLNKHHVTGHFFVVTQWTPGNPNLLRKIALQGHTLSSHTDTHYRLSRETATDSGYNEQLPDAEVETQVRPDIRSSYYKLLDAAGDVTDAKGRPAVNTWFRPPTLAIGKNSMTALFDEGFSYVISGNMSTHDYETTDALWLYRTIDYGLTTNEDGQPFNNGSIVVMHMSRSASITAEAVDILLTKNEAKAANDPTKFEVGDLRDFLQGETYGQAY